MEKNEDTKIAETEEKVVETKNEEVKPKKKYTKFIVLGVLLLLICVALYIAYGYGEKLNSRENIAKKAYEQLVEDGKIDDDLLIESLDSDKLFMSFEDNLKDYLDEEEIKLNADYTTSGSSTVKVKFKDKKSKTKYVVTFSFKKDKDSKAMLIYDKYLISKITIRENDRRKEHVLYAAEGSSKATISTVKGSKLLINGKEIKESFIDEKESDDEKDVYVIKGIMPGDYDVTIKVGSFEFEKEITVYEQDKDDDYDYNEFNLTSYVSSYYMKENDEVENEMADNFKKYITKYYEIALDESKSFDDFKKEYETTDDVEEVFNDSKERNYYKSIDIKKVSFDGFSYDSYDNVVKISYKVEYNYTTEYTSDGNSYAYTRATYNLDDLENPIDLAYLPF